MRRDLQSIVETHEKPFLIIDRSSRILAANQAFLDAYRVSLSDVVGQLCHTVTHGSDRPCHEAGEECPLQRVAETGQPYSCLHIHAHEGTDREVHHVRVKGYPIRLADGNLYLGEAMEEIAVRNAGEDADCMIGRSSVFLATLEAMKLAARSDAPVLLQGETGTGKELAAKFIHEQSSRAARPLMTLDCTVLTEALAESELFGHERGAFTGSVGDRQGLFKLADGGTLFLDEIGELPKALQTKLLRVLESGEFRRVGGNRTIRCDVRIICATNRDLRGEVADGNFRQDLYFRLACLTVQIPALRERREDIPDLAEMLLKRIQRPGQPLRRVSAEALKVLQRYDFPGNIRELKNVLQAASAHTDGPVIGADPVARLTSGVSGPASKGEVADVAPGGDAVGGDSQAANAREGSALQELERAHLEQLVERYAGDRAAIARSLGVSVRTVYRKLNRYGLR